MDLDRYLAAHEASWEELEDICARSGSAKLSLNAEELTTVLDGHQRVSAQLSFVRTHLPSREVEERLSVVLAQTSALIFEQRRPGVRSIIDFFVYNFPAASYSIRKYVLVAFLAMFLPATAMGLWQYNDLQARDRSAPPEIRSNYLKTEFESYYSERPAHEFAVLVFFNNSRVGFVALGMGSLAALPAGLMMANEGYRIGEIAGWFHAEGDASNFWRLLLPHGFLELTAAFFAAGAGIALGWSIIVPGDNSRGRAFAERGRETASVALGLILVFLIAALIEAYVTPAPWHDAIRLGIGFAAMSGFLLYIAVYGKRAHKLGLSGGLGEAPPSLKVG